MENLTGQSLKGYELLNRIGSGGFGVVYRAYQSTIGREVAVKVILPRFSNHPDFIRHFEAEAQLIARLEHLHIVPLYDYWRDPDGTYLVMRWLRGGSLKDALNEEPFDLESTAMLLDQVASGLAVAHDNGIVHRDLKPSNILLDEEGNSYLADFGIAEDLRQAADGSSQKDVIVGSLNYISPEQARSEPVTARSDIYSLGITLYEMLTGENPLHELNTVERLYKHINDPLPRIERLDASVGDEVNDVIQRATAKNPRHRYVDALEMAAAFRAAARLERDRDSLELAELLTLREQDVLRLIVEGQTNQQIAQNLYIEHSTVKWYIRQIYRKLGVRSRRQAIVRAREMKLLVSDAEAGSPAGVTTTVSVALPASVNPYKGLRAFEAADRREYFGWEALVKVLLDRLSLPPTTNLKDFQPGKGRFLAVVGPSGCGKSSLVKAGLIPALWQNGFPGSERWFVVEMVPGARPVDELEVALIRVAADQGGNVRTQLERDRDGLLRASELILPKDGSELVLVIDQFEELFTLVQDEADQAIFLDLLTAAVTDPRSRVRVVLTLRADFYDRPLHYPEFGQLIRDHMETVMPLSAQELEQAIVRPAEQVGVAYEPGLVSTIIDDTLYQPGALPLLQYALTELFEQLDGQLLTHQAYQAIGGVTGALASRAEELYLEQDRDGQEAIQQMFMRLVSVNQQGETLPDTRRRVPVSEMLSLTAGAELMDELIDIYAAYRLLTLDHDPDSRQPIVEVAHEAILREWDRLQGWLEENRSDLSLHRQLNRAAAEWLAAGSDESFLLRGERLTQFDGWAGETQLALNADEQAYLQASIALREEKAAAERERQEQEARLERRASRRLKALVVVVVVALVVVTGLVIAAVSFSFERRLAEESQRLILLRDMTSTALANLESDPELSVLLALEAAKITYAADGYLPLELEDLLHRAVQADSVHLTIGMGGAVAFSPDGQKVAVGDEEGLIRMWDPVTGQDVWGVLRYQFRNQEIGDIAFSPDGQYLATSSPNGSVNIWHVNNSEEIGVIERQEGIMGVVFSPDGRGLMTASADGALRLWDLEPLIDQVREGVQPVEMVESTLFGQEPAEIGDVIYSPDGRQVAVLVAGMHITVLDAVSGEQLLKIPGVGGSASGIAFSPEGNFLAASSSDMEATVWDARTGEEILTVWDASTITAVDFSLDSRYLATATKDGKVTLWNTETGSRVLLLSGHSGRIADMSFNVNGRQLTSSGEDGLTRIWDLDQAGSELFTIAAHEGRAHDAVFNADGTKIASAGDDGLVKVWDAKTGLMLHALPGPKERVHYPAFSPDGHKLAAANQEGGVTIWDANSGQKLLALDEDGPAFSVVVFSPDGARLVAGGQEGIIYIWDALSGERLRDLRSDQDTIMELIFTMNGEILSSIDQAGLSVLWDFTTGERLHTTGCQNRNQIDADVTADGQLVALACDQVFVVQPQDPLDTETILYSLAADGRGQASGVAFNPEGTVLATSTEEGAITLWNMETGEEVLTLVQVLRLPENLRGGFGTTLYSKRALGRLDISPDGRYLAAAGSDGTISVYIMSLEELMEVARSRLSRGFTREECQAYLSLDRCPEES